MNGLTALLSFLILSSLTARGQGQSPQPSVKEQTSQQQAGPTATSNVSGQAKIDPAKEADIRRLLDVTNAAALATQTMLEMEPSMKTVLSNAPFPTWFASRALPHS